MKRRGIARTTAMAMAAAMILTACGGGNADQSTNAPAGSSAQTTTDNGGSGEITVRSVQAALHWPARITPGLIMSTCALI